VRTNTRDRWHDYLPPAPRCPSGAPGIPVPHPGHKLQGLGIQL
jgi:hypothetical protein